LNARSGVTVRTSTGRARRTLTRYRRFRLTFTVITAQLYALFYALYLGEAGVSGSQANEIQTLSRSGTVNAGYFTAALTLEGRTATTQPIAYDATATQIAAALTAASMKWIQPGDIASRAERLQVETATVAGTIGAGGAGNATVIVTAAGMTNSPKTVSVAVANNDTAAQVAGKIRTALGLDADVSAFFTVGGSTTAVILTAKAAAANDATMNIDVDNGTCTGLTTAHTSANTTPGVSAQNWGALGMVVTFQGRLRHAALSCWS
jgi:hypothetical protein